jgi:hypothetical protein
MSAKPNHVTEVVAKILNDRKDSDLLELTDADYFDFLGALLKLPSPVQYAALANISPESVELLLGDPDFVHQYPWETHTLEHPISRPTLDVSNEAECEEKIDITVFRCEEKDASGTTVFKGHVGSMAVDGYVLVKGRSTVSSKAALKDLFGKVNTWAREWKANYAGGEAAGEEKS